MYTVLVVNENRYLINTMVIDLAQNKDCERILSEYPSDADVHFETPSLKDF